MDISIYVATVVIGMIATRAAVVAMRGGWVSQNPVVASLGFVGTFGTIGLLIWGFIRFDWYWPVIAFVGGSVLQAVLISSRNLAGWIVAAPFLDVLVLVGSVYLIFLTG
jgi:hypothetical protein